MSFLVRPRGLLAEVNRADSLFARPKAERSEVTNRVVFGLITWFASLGKSNGEYVCMGY